MMDETVALANHFASEAQGHGITVQTYQLSTDFTRSFVVDGSIDDLIVFFNASNEQLCAFGYWVEVPANRPSDMPRTAFIILKTLGVNPLFDDWGRREVGAVECLQVKERTQITIYASNYEEREHLWAYFNILKKKLEEFGMLVTPAPNDLPSPMQAARREIQEFKALVERQTHGDVFVDNAPQENIARALLQTFLANRSYREVPVRGGQSDLLVFVKEGRFLYEAKIWRGPKRYHQGLKEIEEYIIGEDSDERLLGIFYVVFDPTRTWRAQSHIGSECSTEVVQGWMIDVVN